jgi:ectoine hydroxylase-related dioxygenase (phytanoyl-CoA dioxygenase family)
MGGKALMLAETGYAVVPGPFDAAALAHLVTTYDDAMAQAEPGDLANGSTSVRVNGLLRQSPLFAAIFSHLPLLDAAADLIGGPFKLSAFHGRNVRPGAVAQTLHQDVAPGADGWPLLGFILMVDAFTIENGATRFLPGSQHLPDVAPDLRDHHPDQRHVCGAAGTMILFDGSLWHGHAANRTGAWRRSIQGAMIPRSARAAVDYRQSLPPEAWSCLPPIARHLLG